MGDLLVPGTGVDVVTAECQADGGELVFDENIFDIGGDGSGRFSDEVGSGRIDLIVDGQGSGVFTDTSVEGESLRIEVESEGSGSFVRQAEISTTTVNSEDDGSGYFRFETESGFTTIEINPDGSGTLRNVSETQELEVSATPDGSGSYELTIGQQSVEVERNADGAWRLSQTSPSRSAEYIESADGSASFTEGGERSIEILLAPGVDEAQGLVRPDAPEFLIAGGFPLGTLGSLSAPCASIIRFDATLLFELGEATVQPEAAAALDGVAQAVNESGKAIEINGHTDSIGSDEFNGELSLRRARAVEAELLARGVSVQIDVIGLGETQPVAPNERPDGSDDPAGRALNRRVDIVIRD